jgi:hypothetical protein
MSFGSGFLVGIAVLQFTAGLAIAQQAPLSGLGCVVDMPIPTYRGVFWIAQVTGEAKVTITIGAGGAPASVDVQSTQRALVAWLKSDLQGSVFIDRCAGQTVEIKFIYRLVGGGEEEPRNEVRFRGPATFEVVARPPIPHIEP